MKRVVIIGGGWAGLAAATHLAREKFEVILLERGSDLGGRASSFYDNNASEELDHGQHILIGAYKSTFELLNIWNNDSINYLDSYHSIPFILSNRRTVYLSLASHSNLGAAINLLKFTGMSINQRINTIRALNALRRMSTDKPENETTVANFLLRFGIKSGDCSSFFDALTESVMNTSIDVAGVYPLSRTINRGLLSGNNKAGIYISRVPLKQLFVNHAHKFLVDSGIDVRTSTDVKNLSLNKSDGSLEIKTSKGEFNPDFVIATVQPVDLLRLLTQDALEHPFFRTLDSFGYSPISTVHFTFDKPILKQAFALLPSSFTQWVFGRGYPETNGWRKISAIISNSPGKSDCSLDAIARLALGDLQKRIAGVIDSNVIHQRTIRTIRATVMLTPGSDALRRPTATPVSGLYLAGDWTATGLPATIESAALSGKIAAEEIIRNCRN